MNRIEVKYAVANNSIHAKEQKKAHDWFRRLKDITSMMC